MQTRGIKTPLKFGTVTIAGFIVEETGFDTEAENIAIDDESLDFVVDYSGINEKNSGSVKVIPLDTATEPQVGDIFQYTVGTTARAIVVDNVRRVSLKKDVTRWDIDGHSHPQISLTS